MACEILHIKDLDFDREIDDEEKQFIICYSKKLYI